MKFVTAMLLLLASALCIGVAFAQQTLWRAEPTIEASAQVDTGIVLLSHELLASHPNQPAVTISSDDTLVAATAQTDDIVAWIEDAQFAALSVNAEGGTQLEASLTGIPEELPSPIGSDLWRSELTGDGSITMRPTLDADESIMVVSGDGKDSTQTVTITWPREVNTPTVLPLYIAGGLLLLVGLIVYFVALAAIRKHRRPKRSGPNQKSRKPQGKQPVSKTNVLPESSRRQHKNLSRSVLSACLAGGAVLAFVTGCASSEVVAVSQSPSGTAESSGGDPEVKTPPVDEDQMAIILERISKAADAADSSRQIDDADDRFTGAALELREANYAIRNSDQKHAKPAAIIPGPIQIFLPPTNSEWPRTLFAVVDDPADEDMPIALTLTQSSPRENYQVSYAIQLMSGIDFPTLPGAEAGTVVIDSHSEFLSLHPDTVAEQYIKMLDGDEEASELFDVENDQFMTILEDHRKDLEEGLDNKGTVEFETAVGDQETIAIATADSGALVSTYITDSELMKPRQAGGSITSTGAVKALLGKETTTNGVRAVYGVKLLFYVPPTTGGTSYLLGVSQELISAEELS